MKEQMALMLSMPPSLPRTSLTSVGIFSLSPQGAERTLVPESNNLSRYHNFFVVDWYANLCLTALRYIPETPLTDQREKSNNGISAYILLIFAILYSMFALLTVFREVFASREVCFNPDKPTPKPVKNTYLHAKKKARVKRCFHLCEDVRVTLSDRLSEL